MAVLHLPFGREQAAQPALSFTTSGGGLVPSGLVGLPSCRLGEVDLGPLGVALRHSLASKNVADDGSFYVHDSAYSTFSQSPW
jgi:hypothetical protein